MTKVRQLLDIASASAARRFSFCSTNSSRGRTRPIAWLARREWCRALVETGAVGFVTTHDLSLTAVTDELPGAVNVHFRDDFTGWRTALRLHHAPGVVEHGNGLALDPRGGIEGVN